MHSTGSFIHTAIAEIRASLDETSVDAKFSNDDLVRYYLMPALDIVLTDISQSEGSPVLVQYPLSIPKDTEYFVLPPSMQEVFALTKHTTEKYLQIDWKPTAERSYEGPGWRIDGNTIRFNPIPTTDLNDWILWYMPTGTIVPHYSDAGGAAGATTNTKSFTLSSTPTLGMLDQRPNAYVGMVLRTLPAGGPWEESLISAYDRATRVCTLRTPISPGATSSIRYEIAPFYKSSVWHAVAMKAVLNLGIARQLSGTRITQIQMEYKSALRAARQVLSYRQIRTARALELNTIDRDPWTA